MRKRIITVSCAIISTLSFSLILLLIQPTEQICISKDSLSNSIKQSRIYSDITNYNILQNISKFDEIHSILSTNEELAIPDNQLWSRCQCCGLSNNRIIVFPDGDNVNSYPHEPFDLTSSLWSEFFHQFQNDKIKGELYNNSSSFKALYYIDRPVYILPMITFHFGHILIDLIEEIYSSMMKHYGTIRHDCIFIIDVAGLEERNVLKEKLWNTYLVNNNNSFGLIFRSLIGNQPFFSIELWNELNDIGGVVFSDIHLGLDISESFYYEGYKNHPCIMSLHTSLATQRTIELSKNYRQFSTFIQQSYSIQLNKNPIFPSNKLVVNQQDAVEVVITTEEEEQSVNVLFVQRAKNRVILNMDQLIGVADTLGLNWIECDLNLVTFDDQMQLFSQTDILVSTAGTAVHNLLFMKPNSTVIIIMQQLWCEWSWMYANQAVLLGIKYFIYCTPSAEEEEMNHPNQRQRRNHPNTFKFFQWAHKFWMQGPRSTKSFNITVDVDNFSVLLKDAVSHLRNSSDVVDSDSLVCPGYNPSLRSRATVDSDVDIPSHGDRLIEIYLSELRVTERASGGWQLAIIGDIGMAQNKYKYIFNSIPNLSVCLTTLFLNSPPPSSSSPWCYELNSLNYYSEILLNVEEPVLPLKIWLQTSKSYGAAAISGTNLIVSLDCRFPMGGISLQHDIIGEIISFDVIFAKECEVSDNNGNIGFYEQLLLFPNKQTDIFKYKSIFCKINETLVFHNKMVSSYSFQRITNDFCRKYLFNDYNCLIFISEISQEIAIRKQSSFPPVQHVPTPMNPFVFIHIEKSGGTTLREFIVESADKHGYEYFVPCHDNVHCITLSLPRHDESVIRKKGSAVDFSTIRNMNNISIVAGHFFWEVWNKLPNCHNYSWVTNDVNSVCRPSLFVMGRHPIDRAISYYYQRCFQLESCVGYQRRINELSVEELTRITIYERQADYDPYRGNKSIVILDEGMEDAACRSILNEKATTGLIFGEDDLTIPSALDNSHTDRAISHLRHCIVGILERWNDTVKVMNHWFPWIDFMNDYSRRKMFLYRGKETKDDLLPELYEVLLNFNQCDMKLYDAMKRQFEEQLSSLNYNYFI